ncbi:hypothetical protein SAMN04515671_4080 [Nakamurella panacisegetis]|uniref:Actinobacteria/chloroflexi VLRF1 release factor domain-containing protein n=1 Tax=Nakamurella panacisegetis TaxID=1090615 RepID=A0A1H0SH29_9ACTN|nr:acVLRF1 family peptidyl-tRNA hydrolase [Nakamurella panacisegetis]SDP40558.1 hypothetical protein SAMN04515671_4080 [Nakamurella panacisegetis]
MSTVGRPRPAAGGGIEVEISAGRVVGWVNRFAGRNEGVQDLLAHPDRLEITAGDGTVARIEVPFGPMSIGNREPVEALVDHLAGIGLLGLVLVRGGAHSIGTARDSVVLSSSTDRAYLQGRTAAGGWSQQRYARRRGNQLTASLADAAQTAERVLLPLADRFGGLVLAGDAAALKRVMAEPALKPLTRLPSRTFGDIPEPRRAVLDEVAQRSLVVRIVVRTREQMARLAGPS